MCVQPPFQRKIISKHTVRRGPIRDDLTAPSLRTTPATAAVSHCLNLSQDKLARNSDVDSSIVQYRAMDDVIELYRYQYTIIVQGYI